MYYAYIRVSTPRQGTEGVSLLAQREAIIRYAQQNHVTISAWFEERCTAAKRGRPVFGSVLRLLRKGGACGIVIHKVDRSARNLRDWASIGELIDAGIDVRFAGDSVDLRTRGGRLAADIQAVVAADFIRNLKEETKKGIDARLEHGLLPRRAPLGYADNGPGKAKTVDPAKGPLVKESFELYASGKYSLHSLAEAVNDKGLANIEGGPMTAEILSRIFRNPFYAGTLRASDGRMYPGIHEPLVSEDLFREVSRVLASKRCRQAPPQRHLFSRTFRHERCGRYLIAERHKGHMYYRCHSKGCLSRGFREEAVRNVLSGRMITLGRPTEAATISAGDFWKVREIVLSLSGEISFGEDRFDIEPAIYNT